MQLFTYICSRQNNANDSDFDTASFDDRTILIQTLEGNDKLTICRSMYMEITNLHSWLLTIIDICYYNWRFDIFKKGDDAFDFIVKLMVSNSL